MTDNNSPTESNYERASRLIKEEFKGLDDASQAALSQLRSQYPLAHLQLFPHREADFHAYVFFKTEAQLATSEDDGSRSVIEDRVYTEIANAGKGTRPGISIIFEYDSEENVKENYKGSYYLRMR